MFNLRIKKSSLISYLLYFGLISEFVYLLFFTSIYGETEINAVTTRAELFIRYFALTQLCLAVFLGFLFEGNNFNKYLRIGWIFILIWVGFGVLRDFPNCFNPSVLFSAKGLGTWFLFGLIFTTSDNERWQQVKDLLFLFCLLLAIILFFRFFQLGISYDRKEAQTILLNLTITLLWILPPLLFEMRISNLRNNLLLFCLLILSIASFLLVTRSFIILSILTLLFVILTSSEQRKNLGLIFVVILFFGLPLGILVKSNTEHNIFKQGGQLLELRFNKDTRWIQVAEFIKSTKQDNYLLGVGPNKTWNHFGQKYQWLDNFWLLFSWWAGLPAALAYFLICIYPLKDIFSRSIPLSDKGYLLIVAYWIVALFGLSIFTVVVSKLYFFVVTLYLGRAYVGIHQASS